MIVTGLFSAPSEDPTYRLAWFAGEHRRVLTALWCVYPVVVALGPHGAEVITSTTETGWIVVVDLLAKVAYGLLWTRDHDLITRGDLQRS